jgi:TIGR03009 family protein
MGRRATIRACFLATAWTAGATVAFGQAPQKATPAAPKQAQPAAPQQAQPAAPADPAKMERLLQLWEGQSSRLKTLDAVIFRSDYNLAWEEYEYFEGRAIFKSPNLAYVDFRKIQQDKDNKPVKDPKTKAWVSAPKDRIVCTGNEVWQYESDTKQIFIYPLEKNEAAKALEEGPLPFLFNMKAADAKKRYHMTLMNEAAGFYTIGVRPKLQVDQQEFSQAFIRLDRKFLLPIQIVLHSPDGKFRKDFQLSHIQPNIAVKDETFQGKADPSWKVVRNPGPEDRPGAAAAAAAAAPAGARRRPAPAPAAARDATAPKR